MPVVTVWDDEGQTIIRKDVSDPWTWELYRASREVGLAMMGTVAHPVGIIINLLGVVFPPDLITNVRELLESGMPDNWLLIVLVTHADHNANAMFRLLPRQLPQFSSRIVIASTLDEARAIIAQRQEAAQE